MYPYIDSHPSKKSVARIIEEISLVTDRKNYMLEAKILVRKINSKLIGWINYFKLGAVSKAYHTRQVKEFNKLKVEILFFLRRSLRENESVQ